MQNATKTIANRTVFVAFMSIFLHYISWQIILYKSINVKNLMCCHKLIHPSVSVSVAFAPVLLCSAYHLVVDNKPYQVFVYQLLLLLVCIQQCFLTDSVNHSRNPHKHLEDRVLGFNVNTSYFIPAYVICAVIYFPDSAMSRRFNAIFISILYRIAA